MANLRVGTAAGGERFELPVAIGTQTSAIVGIRGSGKTVSASVIVEELLSVHHQVVILDPTDAWWGLKSSADGKEPGYPVVIFGGPHGDLPLEPEMGKVLADFAVEQRVPMILSLRHLRKGQQQRFVTDFAEQLYHRKGELQNRTPLLVAIDEASAFVPQRVGGAEAQMVGAIEDLVRRGRSAGLGVMLIDRRPASVNKDVLTQLEVLVAHRITSPQDSKALREWVKQHDTAGGEATFLEQLPSLPQGAAWIWSPSLDVFERVQVRMRATFDSSKTPKPGEDVAQPKEWASVDLEALREQLAGAVQKSEENDPKALRARIKMLEKDLELAVAGDRQDYPTMEAYEATCQALNRWQIRAKDAGRALADVYDRIHPFFGSTTPDPILTAGNSAPKGLPTQLTEARKTSVTPPLPDPRPRGNSEGTVVGISKSQQKILDALATYRAFGQADVELVALAMLAGYRPGTGHFNNLRGALNSAGLICYPSPGRVALTDAGAAVAQGRTLQSIEELHAAWMQVLSGPQQKILQVLIDRYPGALTIEELANRSGYSAGTGHFNNLRGSLHTVGAIVYPSRGYAQASSLLFPKGLS